MSKTQRYGIKFPITVVSDDKSLFDTNMQESGSVNSEMMHVLFTPKGQRLRDPEFGTNLIKFIFEPNDNMTWGDVLDEAKTAVTKYVPNCKINNMDVMTGDDGMGLYVSIEYSVWENGRSVNHKTVTQI